MRNVIKTITLAMFVVSTAAPYILQGGIAVAAPKPGSAKNALTARADIEKTLGFVPGFFQTMADPAVSGAWEEMKGLQLNPNTALTGKTKELIGLAVSAQIPCHYCIYAHTEFAKLNGASEAVIAEAVAVGALERHWSAYLFGMQVDESKFRSEIARLVAGAKNPGRPQSNVVVVDARTATMDIEQTLGFFPELLRVVPEYALPGAWREMKELKLNPNTLLNGKEKALIALAVASQVPSRSCVFAETEFAKLAGAAQHEIAEAVGMAAITRNMSTLLNGQQADERAFREDIDRLVSGAKAAQRKPSSMGRHPSAAVR